MKTILLLISIGIAAHQAAWAQNVIRVKGGPNWQHSLSITDRYRYRTFQDGKITYVSGQSATGRLNYNILLGEMQFVDLKGDTLSLANESMIQSIQVGETKYMYDVKNGYLEILDDYEQVKFASKPIFKTLRAEKNGGYNQSSGTSSITQYKSFVTGGGQLTRLEQGGDLLLEKDKAYFIIDSNKRVYKANKAAVLKIFAKNKSALETYLEEQAINFQKEEDLRKLLKYSSSNL